MIRILLASLAAVIASSTARADFTFTAPGPLPSAGAFGDPNNGSFIQNYPGPFQTWGFLNFTGNISPLIGATYLSEAQFVVTSPLGGSAPIVPSVSNTTFPANTPVAASGSVFVYGQPGAWRFEAVESFDDGPGGDAVWNSASFNYVSASPLSLGTFSNSNPLSIDTFGSSFDTELFLLDSFGNVLASNDDFAGLQSLIAGGFLDAGQYTIAHSGFDSEFNGIFGIPGGAGGNLLLNVNGTNYFAGAHAGGTFTAFQFSISTPAPAAVWMGFAGIGLLAGVRRRFAKN